MSHDDREWWAALYDQVTDADRTMILRLAAACARQRPRPKARPAMALVRGRLSKDELRLVDRGSR